MTNLIKADFNGIQVFFQNNGYLNATSICVKLGKKVNNYTRNEQTKNYIKAITRIRAIDEKQLLIVKKGSPANGGGTWLHPKLAIDFARWLSAEFAVWCDEQIEKILHGNQQPQNLDRLSTSDDRVGLRQAVSKLVSTKGLLYPDAYNLVNGRMGTEHIDEMTVAQAEQATDFVYYLMANDVLDGELMPKIEQTEPHGNPLTALTLMKYGGICHATQTLELEKLDLMLYEMQQQIKKIQSYNGGVSDGLHEAQARLNFPAEMSSQATVKAVERFENRKF